MLISFSNQLSLIYDSWRYAFSRILRIWSSLPIIFSGPLTLYNAWHVPVKQLVLEVKAFATAVSCNPFFTSILFSFFFYTSASGGSRVNKIKRTRDVTEQYFLPFNRSIVTRFMEKLFVFSYSNLPYLFGRQNWRSPQTRHSKFARSDRNACR